MSCELGPVLKVYNNRNQPTTLVFGYNVNGVVSVIDFNAVGDAVTRIELEFYINDVYVSTVDSATSPTAMDWTGNDGEVIFDLGGESLTASAAYEVRMFIYSPSRPLGTLLDRGDLYTFNAEVINV